MEALSYGPFITRKQAQEQGLKWYFTGKPCKHGHFAVRQTINGRCKQCGSAKNAANFKRWYEEKGRSQVIQQSKKWQKQNPEKRKEIANRYAAKVTADPMLNARKNKRRREGDRSKIRSVRYQNDKNFRIRLTLKGRLACALKLQSAKKAHKSAQLLGLSVPQFKEWIASQFQEWMTWENWGYETWHIDHVRPCSSFDLTDPAQQLLCFNWRNQQPLAASQNMSKNDKWTAEAEAEWIQQIKRQGWTGELFPVFHPATMSA